MRISQLLESDSHRDFGATIYHGTRSIKSGVFDTQKAREKSKTTYLPIHKMLSTLSHEKFNIDVRSLTFASMDVRKTKPYGPALELIPHGNRYRVFVNDGVSDMTVRLGIGFYDIRNNVIAALQNTIYESYFNDDIMFGVHDLIYGIHHGKIEADDLRDVYYKLQDYLHQELKKQGHDDFVENGLSVLLEEIANVMQQIEKNIKAYIDGITEVSHESEINSKSSELMLYLPDGFELKDIT